MLLYDLKYVKDTGISFGVKISSQDLSHKSRGVGARSLAQMCSGTASVGRGTRLGIEQKALGTVRSTRTSWGPQQNAG